MSLPSQAIDAAEILLETTLLPSASVIATSALSQNVPGCNGQHVGSTAVLNGLAYQFDAMPGGIEVNVLLSYGGGGGSGGVPTESGFVQWGLFKKIAPGLMYESGSRIARMPFAGTIIANTDPNDAFITPNSVTGGTVSLTSATSIVLKGQLLCGNGPVGGTGPGTNGGTGPGADTAAGSATTQTGNFPGLFTFSITPATATTVMTPSAPGAGGAAYVGGTPAATVPGTALIASAIAGSTGLFSLTVVVSGTGTFFGVHQVQIQYLGATLTTFVTST